MKPPINRFTVSGNSMLPTLKPGQDIVSQNWFYYLKIGDIVVIKKDGQEWVKRIIKIEEDQILVEGDNKEESSIVGFIHKNQIIGKIIYSPDLIDCPNCGAKVVGIYGRKDAVCTNCGFKLTCCGEP